MIEERKGLFIVFEGIDGSGKTTIANRLVSDLRKRFGQEKVVYTFEPNDWDEEGRRIISGEIKSSEELVRFFIKNRQTHVNMGINRWLSEGRIIVCDRYYHSTVAYQGAMGENWLDLLNINQTLFPSPDKVFYLAVTVSNARKRIVDNRDLLSFFEKNEDYLKLVSSIYFESFIHSTEEVNVSLINANLPINRVYDIIFSKTLELIDQWQKN